ncbi:DNA-binding transcriptional MerR regulator [Deinococcus metalli]|uniref:DNA-binding transcriptional MerR regulator n=1 Tax=Deinococcus metalli TaxID=1141878 RepID=A0A7W8KD73_9DEIO|nr:MerR family transcriptional regulator [Deinococcus metalli]MBB5374903.1 DNA-binding transcriptional MerR regulator [Deinococcus metalli]GHF32850.1 HTH-type transcriptional activator TipA [Deinococcus metalli]
MEATVPTPHPAHWTVGEVAALTRVSVRTLHHYDSVGLLRPSGRSEGNYRQYTAADLARLWRILAYRDLGFSLAEIAGLLDAGGAGELAALRTQAALLRTQAEQVHRRLAQVEVFIRAAERGEGVPIMTNDDIKQVFGGFDPETYEPEVQERWGDTDAYRQSRARTARYTKADWEAVRAEMDAVTAAYVALLDAGTPPDSPAAQAVAARHHAHIDTRYYDAPPAMMRGLAQMWVQDERFTRTIDRARSGLAAYQSAAVTAWADAQERPQP